MSGHEGLFVAFEGGDGAGKSTQLRLLSGWLGEAGIDHVLTREPGGTPLGRVVRVAVLHGGDVTPRAEALLYAADRAQHVDTVVRPALERGAVVVTDRYIDSSIAYQGGARGLGSDAVGELSRWATRGLVPDLVVLLDLTPQEGARRRAAQAGRRDDRIEAEPDSFHAEVRDRFLRLSVTDPERYLVLDATFAPGALHDAVRTEVTRLLEARGIDTVAVGGGDASGPTP